MKYHRLAEMFPLLEGEELDALVESIRTNGLREPITLYEDRILDGRNRYRACRAARVEPKFTTLRSGSPLAYVIDKNLKRRHLNASQRAVLALEVLPLLEAEARKRQVRKPGVVGAQMRSQKQKAAADAARIVNASPRYVEQAKRIAKAAPALIDKVRSGAKTLTEAERELREANREQRRSNYPATVPNGTFSVVVIDPPWQYGARAVDATHRARNPYPSMTLAEIAADISDKLIATDKLAPDSVVWLWTTNAFMHDAYHLLEQWGLDPKTVLTWAKPKMGLGDWLRGKTEHCILATRGNPMVRLSGQTTLLEAPAREHSRKPDEFYRLVEGLCLGPRLDWYSREPREGWAQYGNEPGAFLA